MKSRSQRKLSSFRPQRSPSPDTKADAEAAEISGARLAARLRALARRLAKLDEALASEEEAEPLGELDAVRLALDDVAAACEGLKSPTAELERGDESIRRLAWAVQALEACRRVDATFSARLADVRIRLDEVVRSVALEREP